MKSLDEERAAKIEQAANLIEEVITTLDGSRHRCDTCGIDVLRNKDDARKLDNLSGIHERLGRVAGAFRASAKR